MSVTVSNCNQICNSPLNQSRSKQLYSFPKSERFKYQQKSICQNFCYDLPPVQDKRKAGIGYSNKFDFTKVAQNTPAPNNYEIESDFNNKKKGKTIGVGREKMESQGIMGHLNKVAPGPGQYDLGSTKSKVKYSFRQRVTANDPFNVGTVAKNPGPGQYQPPTSLSTTGKYFNSKFKSSGAQNWNPPRSKRFQELKGDNKPGPGQYSLKISINETGNYFVSGYKSSKCRTFSHDLRKTFSTGSFKTPGPGNYQLPSDFGHYQAANIKE